MASRTATLGLATGLAGFVLGSYRSEPPVPLPLMLNGVTITGVHPAALDLQTAGGQGRHFLIDPLDRQWADPFVHEAGKNWHL